MQFKLSLLLACALAASVVSACDVCEDGGDNPAGTAGTGAGVAAATEKTGDAATGAGTGNAGAGAANAGAANVGTGAADAGAGDDKAAEIIAQLEADMEKLRTMCPAAGAGAAAAPVAADAAAAAAPPAANAAAVAPTGAIGQCSAPPQIEFAPGLDGRKADEFSFRPANPIQQFSGQSTALNPVIIVNFLCDRLGADCKDKASETKCRDFKSQIEASKDRSGKVADDFNALFGGTTNFASVGPAANPA